MIPASALKKAVAKQSYLQWRERVHGGGRATPEVKPATEKVRAVDRLIKHAFK